MSEVKRYRAGDFVPVTSVAASDFDAQRLRADTAEAELAKLRERHDTVKCQRNDATKVLAAAEQRIGELWQLVEKAYDHETIDDDWIEEYRRLKMSDAALNQKSEGKSQ